MKFNNSTLAAIGSVILLSTVLTPAAAGTAPASSSDRPPVLCFAPGTPDWYVQQAIATASLKRVHHSLAGGGESEFQFPDGNRWYRTATDGSGLDQGDPTTLTWSVIPDGTTIPGYAGEVDAPSNLRAYLTGIYGDEATWLSILQQVFDRWGALSGVIYQYEPWDDGASFVSSEGSIGNRGDIRIGGHNIDGNSGILAYNFYPDVGDMVIDTGDSFYTNLSGNSLRLRNVVAHEHGHGLGLQHVCPVNQTKLMEPYYSSAFDGPQHDDVLAVNRGYGDDFETNDDPASASHLVLSPSSISVHDISIDNNYDVDDFSLTVGSSSSLSVSVTPIGWTYLSGPQTSGGSCTAGTSFDSLNVHDLAIRVLDTNGTTELASSNVNGVGMSETLTNVPLSSGSGTYYVEVEGDSTDQCQLYRLDLSVTGGPAATPTPTPTPVPPTPTRTPTPVPPTPTPTRTPTNTAGAADSHSHPDPGAANPDLHAHTHQHPGAADSHPHPDPGAANPDLHAHTHQHPGAADSHPHPDPGAANSDLYAHADLDTDPGAANSDLYAHADRHTRAADADLDTDPGAANSDLYAHADRHTRAADADLDTDPGAANSDLYAHAATTWTPTQVPPTPTFTHTPTWTPTQVPPTPTFTHTPTWTPTQVPPTPTFTHTPTNTPVPPVPTSTPTRTPSPTPTPSWQNDPGLVPTPVPQPVIFQDGFESGNLGAWISVSASVGK